MSETLLKNDMTKKGWILMQDFPVDGELSTPEIVNLPRLAEFTERGIDLRTKINHPDVLNQHHAEYLLDHPHLIPKEFECKYSIIFPGTILRCSVAGVVCDMVPRLMYYRESLLDSGAWHLEFIGFSDLLIDFWCWQNHLIGFKDDFCRKLIAEKQLEDYRNGPVI